MITIIVALLAIAFFAGMETAFLKVNSFRVALRREQGSQRGRLLSGLLEQPKEFMVAMLIGNAILLVLLGDKMNEEMQGLIIGLGLPLWAVPIMTIIATTAIVLLFAEFLPKVLVLRNPDGILLNLTFPLFAIFTLLKPFVWFFLMLSKGILSLFTTLDSKNESFTRRDLETLLDEMPDDDDNSPLDKDIFESALSLPDTTVRDAMVPRTEIMACNAADGIDALRRLFIDTQHSKVLVYNENIDQTLGYVHHHRLLGVLSPDTTIADLIIPMPIVPEVMPVRDLMNRFLRDRTSIAVVVDEFGGTAGIITLEDILEEIFGEIKDEYDDEDLTEEVIGDGREYRLAGRLEIDYLNEKYALALPDGEYQTLSGYIIHRHEDIPATGDKIVIDNYEFCIEEANSTRIEVVRVFRVKSEE